jgi:SanA protein
MLSVVKWLVISLISFVVFCNVIIVFATQDKLCHDSRELIGAEVGLVFGTSQYSVDGNSNPFFLNRLEAAKQLLESGKVEKLILSGSKDSVYYDEAKAMKVALVDAGISESKLILDNHGDRTLESIARLRDIHGYKQCILITQEYHAYRCIFIADHLQVEAQAFVAKTPNRLNHFKALSRELLARTKAVIDIYILRV